MLKILLAVREPEAVLPLLQGHQTEILPKDAPIQERVSKNSYHLILLEGETALVDVLKSADPRAELILLGRENQDALEAIKQGAAAYFTLPVEPGPFREAIEKIHEVMKTRKETGELERLLADKYTFAGMTAKNPQMLEILSFTRRIAPYYRTVLITGETGAGKEVVAKALHAMSPSSKHPFLVCNCAGWVEHLIESELFGHLKGAFTGADRDKIGLFEAAGEGTLFVDEIGELPLAFQPHLLRVLQDGEFRRVGSHQPSKARCRVVAATHRDLEKEVKEGRFREDLFFRIAPLVIKVPPLRDRKDDLLLLSRVILDRFARRTGKKVYGISRPAQSALMAYFWPGNVRELENILEQAAILTPESFIRLEDLPARLKSTPSEASFSPTTLAEIERRHIEATLHQTKGNRTQAAALLGVSRRALLRKIEKFHLQ